MSTQFMVTVTGTDRSGVVKKLAEKTHHQGGKWLNSKVVHLEGLFAGIIKIDVPTDAVDTLKRELEALDGLQVVFTEPGEIEKVPAQPMALTIEANDRPGLVSDITHLLMDNGVSIENMECHRFFLTNISDTMFSASFSLQVPLELDRKALTEQLESLGEDGIRVTLDTAEMA